MQPVVISRRDLAHALFVSFFLAVFLCAGFLPTAREFALRLVPNGQLGQMLAFPVLAAVFYFSLPTRRSPECRFGTPALWATLTVPIVIAAVFGSLHHGLSLREAWHSPQGRLGIFWYLVCIGFGEELLFRGWFYNVVDRIWARGIASVTNPLPLAVWMTSLAFSIWHWQNLATDPWGSVLLQSTYTFFTGLWLGYLRWKTGSLALPIAGHIAINAAGGLF